MGFKDYCNNTSFKSNKKDDEKKVEELYNKYKDKDEDELFSELLKNVDKQKQDGIFDYNSLTQMVNKISPFLTKEQNLKIKDLLEKIK